MLLGTHLVERLIKKVKTANLWVINCSSNPNFSRVANIRLVNIHSDLVNLMLYYFSEDSKQPIRKLYFVFSIPQFFICTKFSSKLFTYINASKHKTITWLACSYHFSYIKYQVWEMGVNSKVIFIYFKFGAWSQKTWFYNIFSQQARVSWVFPLSWCESVRDILSYQNEKRW